jgi:hypothetical protein
MRLRFMLKKQKLDHSHDKRVELLLCPRRRDGAPRVLRWSWSAA